MSPKSGAKRPIADGPFGPIWWDLNRQLQTKLGLVFALIIKELRYLGIGNQEFSSKIFEPS